MTHKPFLAMITPLSDTGGGGGGGGGGEGIWGPTDPRPSNPIAGMGPGGNFPGSGGPGGGTGIWGPNDPRPSNPIAGMGPGGNFPGEGGGSGPPLVIWGPNDPRPGWGLPDLPEEITPPPAQGQGGEPVPVEWKSGWTQDHGWVVVGIPTGPHPSPSRRG